MLGKGVRVIRISHVTVRGTQLMRLSILEFLVVGVAVTHALRISATCVRLGVVGDRASCTVVKVRAAKGDRVGCHYLRLLSRYRNSADALKEGQLEIFPTLQQHDRHRP